jgi:SPX domain protein involved in polyphosphate accumulation
MAMELKFLMPVERANIIRGRAVQELERDPYSSSSSDGYQVCSLYLDTPNFDVLHRHAELNGTKYRFRQYGESTQLFLERKQRVSGVVQKKRQSFSKENLEGFLAEENELCSEIRKKAFQPSCAVRYQRDAFYDPKGDEVCRATFDYNLSVDIFETRTWGELITFLGRDLTHRNSTQRAKSKFLFQDWAVVEFKFINSLPLRLKRWVEEYQMVPMNFSKYRSAMVVGFDG